LPGGHSNNPSPAASLERYAINRTVQEMEDKNKLIISGQWYGYFSYGPQYGSELEGEKVIFSLLIDEVFNNKFKGKCIELNGIGASEEISKIEGFIENNFISFRKEYSEYFSIDTEGNTMKSEDSECHELSYEGTYNFVTKTFSGDWEIWFNEKAVGEYNYIQLGKGTWEISKDATKYGV
jgi:hypothetical protein